MQFSLWQVLVLAVVQGVTEFLPISSDGHLVVVAPLLFGTTNAPPHMMDLTIVLHMGTLGSILVYYRQRVARLVGEDRRVFGLICLGTVPAVAVVLIATFLTTATVTPAAFLTAVGVTVLIAVPFILMGLAIGYSLPQKAALVVAQVLFFPLAFAGGLMTPPGGAPGFIEDLAPYLPTGGAVRLMWAAVGEYPVNPGSVASLVAWTIALGGVAVWAYRRDEGRRFS